MKKKIIFVLVFNEWDGGGGDISENVIASSSEETIKAYKKDLENKSLIIQDKILSMQKKRDKKIRPLWKELHPILQELAPSKASKMDSHKRKKLIDRKKELTEAQGVIHQEYYKKKEDLLNSLNMEYYLDDPTLSSFTIEELEVI